MRGDGFTKLISIEGRHPSLSPDWEKIAYWSEKEGGIWIINTDGSNKNQLTTRDGAVLHWSPDKKKIFFMTYVGEKRTENLHLFVINSNGSNEKQLTFSEQFPHGIGVGSMDWSPDGGKIALPGIYIINSDGSNVRFLTSGYGGGQPVWSADGKKIFFVGPQVVDHNYSIWSIDLDGDNLKQLTTVYGLVWSPDRSKIAYQHYGIFVVNSDGSNRKRLTLSSDSLFSGSWSPNGKRIAFFRVR